MVVWGLVLLLLSSGTVAGQDIVWEVSNSIEEVNKTKCANHDVADAPARFFVDIEGKVQMIAPQRDLWRSVGDNIDQLAKNCVKSFTSDFDPLPRNYNESEWLVSPYTENGKDIFALVHNEYHGWEHNNCAYSGSSADWWKCWWNSINLASSGDGGKTYTHLPAPGHNIVNSPIDYNPTDSFRGYFEPSNIVKKDGFYYALVLSLNNGTTEGTCIMRTTDLSSPKSWKLWDGSGFNLSGDRAKCKPVMPYESNGANPHYSLSYNSYLEKYLSIDCERSKFSCKYSTSKDLVIWEPKKDIPQLSTNPYWKFCGYPSFIQPGDKTRNFEVTDRSPWLYYVASKDGKSCDVGPGGTEQTLYRTRVRINKSEDVGKYELLDLRFSEKRGLKTLDASFLGNNGTLEGDATLTGNTVRFQGGGGIRIEDKAELRLTGNITIKAKVKLNSLPTDSFPTIIRKEETGIRNYGLYLTPEGKVHFSYSNQTGGMVGGSSNIVVPVDQQWHSIEIRVNENGVLEFYIDEQLAGRNTTGIRVGAKTSLGPVLVGDQNFNGEIDDLKIFNYSQISPTTAPPPPCGKMLENCCVSEPRCESGLECSSGGKCLRVPTPLPTTQKVVGDANGDSMVDLSDQAIWKSEYLTQSGTGADFNGDGKVDMSDLGIWKTENLK